MLGKMEHPLQKATLQTLQAAIDYNITKPLNLSNQHKFIYR